MKGISYSKYIENGLICYQRVTVIIDWFFDRKLSNWWRQSNPSSMCFKHKSITHSHFALQSLHGTLIIWISTINSSYTKILNVECFYRTDRTRTDPFQPLPYSCSFYAIQSPCFIANVLTYLGYELCDDINMCNCRFVQIVCIFFTPLSALRHSQLFFERIPSVVSSMPCRYLIDRVCSFENYTGLC